MIQNLLGDENMNKNTIYVVIVIATSVLILISFFYLLSLSNFYYAYYHDNNDLDNLKAVLMLLIAMNFLWNWHEEVNSTSDFNENFW